MPKALGLVETRGLVAAIEAADAMLKTSNVTLIGKEVTNPALITIKIVGDVAAVKASVDAGAAAAARVGELVSIHVIPQPDLQMTVLFPEISDDDDPSGGGRKLKPEKKRKADSEKSSPKDEPAEAGSDSAAGETEAEQAAGESEAAAIEDTSVSEEEISMPEEEESAESGLTKDTEEESGRPVSAGKPLPTKAPVSKPVKTRAPKPKKESDNENLFTVDTDHLERLRREALGIKEPKEAKQSKTEKKSSAEPAGGVEEAQGRPTMEELEKLNVHNLRKAAREMEEFPIQGREISRANRRALLDLFKKII